MLDQRIQELESSFLARIASARSAEELETVRVEALGRKEGALTLPAEIRIVPDAVTLLVPPEYAAKGRE